MPAPYEVYAIRYARHERTARARTSSAATSTTGRCRSTTSSGWSRGEAGTFVIDTGFDAGAAPTRGRQLITPVGDGLVALGVDAARGATT